MHWSREGLAAKNAKPEEALPSVVALLARAAIRKARIWEPLMDADSIVAECAKSFDLRPPRSSES